MNNLYFIHYTNEKMLNQGYEYAIYTGDFYGYHLFSSDKKRAFKRIVKKLRLAIDHIGDCYNKDTIYYKQKLVEMSFKDKKEIPHKARKIRLLSNGSIVWGYVLNKGNELFIYRPNPNAKKVYKPLSLKRHIKYSLKHGTF